MGAVPAEPRIAALAAHRDAAGLFLDFDGSLSEIAPTPEEARPVDGASNLLAELADCYRIVAVVSGRRAWDVAALLGAPAGVRFFGLYGLEEQRGEADPSAGALVRAMGALLSEVERAAARVPGARVEPKGIQVAVHYRGASDHESARRTLMMGLGEVASTHGLHLLEGKRVIELAPALGPTKGDVVERLAAEERLRYVLFAGDDLADLDAFAAVDRLAGSGMAGIKVAVRSEDTPEEIVAAADLVVEGPAGLVGLLRELVAPRGRP